MRGCAIPAAVQSCRAERPFFDNSEIPEPQGRYVAWLDTMGAASIMARSMGIAANFLGKLHTAALRTRQEQAAGDDLTIYPLVDGCYITASRQGPFLGQLKGMMRKLALTFIMEDDPLFHFMVRCCVAFGPVWEGTAFMTSSNVTLRDNPQYTKQILLGPAVAQAHEGERLASPFGVWVHESARAFAPSTARPIMATHWQWWRFSPNAVDTEIAMTLVQHLNAYLAWCKSNNTWLLYPETQIAVHTQLVTQYFRD
jgi:hypothetical protein